MASTEPEERVTDEIVSSETPTHATGRGGQWQDVVMSGLVVGVVLAIARAQLPSAWLLPTGLAYAICVTNPNLGFSWFQKLATTGLAYAIGFHWQPMVELLRQGMQNGQ